MLTTSISLLQRVRQSSDNESWTRFVHLYTPLLCRWARRMGLNETDAADLVQEVLLQLVRSLPLFEYDAQRSFRAWLRTVLHNKYRERLRKATVRPAERANALPEELPQPEPLHDLEEQEYRQHLLHGALQLLEKDFEPSTLAAFRQHALEGRPVGEVAAELGLSVKAVYLAKTRVLRRLRQELAELLD